MGLTINDFRNYYKKYKELFGLEKNPNIPSLYSENVEIKATTSQKGTTTINPYRKFHVLFWLFIDIGNDRLTVKKLPFNNFKETFLNDDLENVNQKKIRLNINLQNYVKEGDEVQHFDLNSLEEIK